VGLIAAILRSRLVWTALFVGLLFSAAPRLQRFMMRDPRFYAIPAGFAGDAPAWGGRALVEPSLEALRRLGPLSLFDPRFEERIGAALRRRPEVESVDAVLRHWPDRYSVAITFRRPVAVVESAAGPIPVDAEGVALPAEPCAEAIRGLLRIAGVRSDPPPFGRVWRDESLRDGLLAARQIAPHLDELLPLGIATIDVSEARARLVGVRLLGADGLRVRWGRPGATVGENPVGKKIELLRAVLPSVDMARGRELDVRFGSLYVVRESTTP
jgi:hypothetical protein